MELGIVNFLDGSGEWLEPWLGCGAVAAEFDGLGGLESKMEPLVCEKVIKFNQSLLDEQRRA